MATRWNLLQNIKDKGLAGNARGIILTLIGLLVLGTIGMAPRLWRERQLRASVKAVDTSTPLVAVGFPTRAPRITEVVLPGSIQAVQETAIYARVDGYLKRRLVNIGDQVQNGQVLAEVDTPELDQQLYQARATLAQATSALQQARATLQHNETQLEYNITNLDRWRTMKERDLVAQQDLDDRQVLVKSGQADVDAARANVAAAEANVTANRANVERLINLQSFQKVRAPFSGVITVRNVDNGALISAGSSANNQPLFRMAQTDSLRIFVNVPQTFMVSMQPGLAAEIAVREFPRRTFAAQVAGVSGALDPTSRTLLTEVHSDPPFIIPASALIIRSASPQVAIVGKDHKLRFQVVHLGRDYGSTVEVLEGLSDRDQLLLAPSDDLQEGEAVRIVTPSAGAKPARS